MNGKSIIEMGHVTLTMYGPDHQPSKKEKARREARDARLRAQAIEAQKITNLQICQTIQGGRYERMDFIELTRALRKPRRETVGELAIVSMAVERAESDGLVEETGVQFNLGTGRGVDVYGLTDAGRHVLMTSVTGPAAHAVLADIEAEMAGAA
ncbi:MAG: hypothetical protein EOO23_04660 [Comamonadaceae bacterium]|nr:MAG: hypothetical protein EOO23_04660 [Comamonadaceae bacterium]